MEDASQCPDLATALRKHRAGELAAAEADYRSILIRRPLDADALHLLGLVAGQTGRFDIALDSIARAVRIHPRAAIYRNSLGNVLSNLGRREEAVTAFLEALRLQPNLAGVHNNLGNARKEMGEIDEAEQCYRRAVELQPNYPEALSNLGTVLKDQGRLDEGLSYLEQAIALKPNDAMLRSTRLYLLQFHPAFESASILAEAKAWDHQFGGEAIPRTQALKRARPADQKLRIGYVSPNFRDHVVGRNVLPLFEHFDRDQFEVYGFANIDSPDAMTSRFKKAATGWHDIRNLSDDALVELVRGEAIDIIVDLTLHMAGNRLTAFARRLAPVQVTFAGYPGTTGLRAMDYRISDPFLDPADVPASAYSEITIRLPHSFWCYMATPSAVPLSAPPACQAGHMTFGCLNAFAKINDDVLDLWSALLARVPHSKLMLLAPKGDTRQRTLARFKHHNIMSDRILFRTPSARSEYLSDYRKIDIALDPFPYNGHTTSLDAIWMGVPLVSLVGRTVAGRAGLSQLSNVGLTELIAETPEQYLRIASHLAENLPRLKELRGCLREKLEASPIMDATGFTRAVESAYLTMWRNVAN